MSEEMNKNEAEERQMLFEQMTSASELYTMVSRCTNRPYVVCDPETYDDEILLYFNESEIDEEIKRMKSENIPVVKEKLGNQDQQLPIFFTSLYTLGVNAILFHRGERKDRVQLNEIVRRKEQSELPEGEFRIENPELHLTMIYYMQESRRPMNQPINERFRELQEEIMSHFLKGKYLLAVRPDEQATTPMFKAGDNTVFQPIFTDLLEFSSFNKTQGNQFRPLLVEAERLPQALTEEAKGVIINKMGVNLSFVIKK